MVSGVGEQDGVADPRRTSMPVLPQYTSHNAPSRQGRLEATVTLHTRSAGWVGYGQLKLLPEKRNNPKTFKHNKFTLIFSKSTFIKTQSVVAFN